MLVLSKRMIMELNNTYNTQDEAAYDLGIDQATISRLMSGDRALTANHIQQIITNEHFEHLPIKDMWEIVE